MGIPQCRQVRITLTVWPKHTVVTMATRDGRDSFVWDRRRHTWDVPIECGAVDLAEAEAMAMSLVEHLQGPG